MSDRPLLLVGLMQLDFEKESTQVRRQETVDLRTQHVSSCRRGLPQELTTTAPRSVQI